MFKKSMLICVFAAFVIGAFTACGGNPGSNAGANVVTDFEVTSDASQISVKWTPASEDILYFVYAGKNENERPSEWSYKGCIYGDRGCNFTVKEAGRYYVWIQTEENGPVSQPKAVDVEFISPATNITVTPTILGFKLSWDNPEADLGDSIAVRYKKDNEDWTGKLIMSHLESTAFNGLEDGNYIFKVVVTDKYKTDIPSAETTSYSFDFNETKYGNKPADGTPFSSSYTLRKLSGDADFFYFQAEKGKQYNFEVLDYNSYELARINQSSWSNIDTRYFISADLKIYIAGSCPMDGSGEPDPDGLVEKKNFFTTTNYTLYYKCERTGWYIIKVSKAKGYHQPEGSYADNPQYGLSWKVY